MAPKADMNAVLARCAAPTATDPKSVTELTPKGAEELGELARAALVIDRVAGCTHRTPDPRNALEEAVDVGTCIFAVAFKLGFTIEDICATFEEKMKKWEANLAHSRGLKLQDTSLDDFAAGSARRIQPYGER